MNVNKFGIQKCLTVNLNIKIFYICRWIGFRLQHPADGMKREPGENPGQYPLL